MNIKKIDNTHCHHDLNNDNNNNDNNNENNNNKEKIIQIEEIDNNFMPIMSKKSKNMFNKLLDSVKNKRNRNLNIGVLKFKDKNNIKYIHCPIKKIKENGKIIKVGVCKTFKSVIDNKENKKLLTIHKFKDHYHCRPPDHDAIQLRLNTKKTFDEILNIYKAKDDKRRKNKIF
jgi:hypothetical protein